MTSDPPAWAVGVTADRPVATFSGRRAAEAFAEVLRRAGVEDLGVTPAPKDPPCPTNSPPPS